MVRLVPRWAALGLGLGHKLGLVWLPRRHAEKEPPDYIVSPRVRVEITARCLGRSVSPMTFARVGPTLHKSPIKITSGLRYVTQGPWDKPITVLSCIIQTIQIEQGQ